MALPNGDFESAKAAALRAEELGYYAVTLPDHFFMRGLMEQPMQPRLECFVAFAALASVTTRVRLLPLVTAMSYRNPAHLAKIMATLDHVSRGRLIAGVGAGWFKEEYAAYNYPYPSNSERLEQLQDAIRLLKAMWTQEVPSYHGRFFSVEQAYCNPKPVQKPFPPILVGGGGKKLIRIAAEEADIVNVIPPVLHGAVDVGEALKFDKRALAGRVAMVKQFASEAGRSSDSIEISGMSFVVTAKDKAQADSMVQMVAASMGVKDVEAAKRSPMVLAGTIDEVKRELRSRIDAFGMTLFCLNFPVPELADLFAREIMPEFAS
jgi:probable F420-dependent oxidoreductase